MPLEDALSLVSKDFDHFMLSGRRAGGLRRLAPPPAAPDVSHLLGKAASGASLSSSELSAVISALQKQKQDDNIASSSHNGISFGKLLLHFNEKMFVFPVYGNAPCRLVSWIKLLRCLSTCQIYSAFSLPNVYHCLFCERKSQVYRSHFVDGVCFWRNA